MAGELLVLAFAQQGTIELYSCSIPPGSSYGWTEVETFEGLYRFLA